MKKSYYAPVFGPRHELLRYAGAVVEATGPEGASRLKPGDEKRKDGDKKGKRSGLTPLGTGRTAAFAAICATLAKGERVLKRTVRSLG